MSVNINWFPGHMQKATRQVYEIMKKVDVIIELGDARIPLSSKASNLQDIVARRPHLLVLTKADLNDEVANSELEKHPHVLVGNLNDGLFIKKILKAIMKEGQPVIERYRRKGMKVQPITVMIVGIPNVGKSTLINKLANRKAASVENKPGHTRANQYIKVNEHIALIDTPGILSPNFDNPSVGINLALVGTIRQDILPISDLATYLYNYLSNHYLDALNAFYQTEILSNHTYEEALLIIGKRRGIIGRDDHIISRVETLLLNDFKAGSIGRFALEHL